MAAYDITWAAAAAGSLTTDSNWAANNINDAVYRWIVSASGTDEYYLDLIGGGDPGTGEPDNVAEAGSNMAAGTVGSLTAGQWDWADNDTLGYSTIYVRLTTGGPDPDTQIDGFITFTRDPATGDRVNFTSNGNAGSSGLDSPTITLASCDIEASYTGFLGSATSDERHIAITSLDIGRNLGSGSPAGSGRILLDLGTAQNTTRVYRTASTGLDTNREALRIRGTHTSNAITVYNGSVGLGTNALGDLATFALSQFGGTVIGGTALTLKDTLVDGTSAVLKILNGVNSGATLILKQGEVQAYGTGTIPTLKLVDSGSFKDYSTGTYTTTTVGDDATLFASSGAKTFTTLNLYGVLDLSSATGAITVSTCNVLSEDATVIDPYGKLPNNTDFVLGAGVRSFNYSGAGGDTIRIQA